ncbi:MAG: glucose-1-phosphate cytidylyltransferase [Agarilytica sp.]
MKVVIFAGGLGSRLSEETSVRPKPMVEVGGMPIIWHIMKIYSFYGFTDFVICLGYKGYVFKEFFLNYFGHKSNLKIDLQKNNIEYSDSDSEPWKIELVDTGLHTMTGGRLARVKDYIDTDQFLLTYGDAVTDLPINRVVDQHLRSDNLLTLTAVHPPARFGHLVLDDDHKKVVAFKEKDKSSTGLINGGFFVVDKRVIDCIDSDDCVWEEGPLDRLTKERKLGAFVHQGFWQPMDTIYERNYLEKLWLEDDCPWRVWG